MTFQRSFPEKKDEAINLKIGYIVNHSGKVEIYRYHYFSKQDDVCLVRVLSEATMEQAERWAKTYEYTLRTGKELPEYWEGVN